MEDGHTSMAIHQQSNLPGTRVIADYPLAGLFDLVLRAHVPQDDRMITAARGKNLAIRAEGEARYSVRLPCEDREFIRMDGVDLVGK